MSRKQVPRLVEQAIWKDKIKKRVKIEELKFKQAAEQEFIATMSALMKDDFDQELVK